MNAATCGDCRFWIAEDETLGECHRRAPCLCKENPPDPEWPMTGNDNFCGELELRQT